MTPSPDIAVVVPTFNRARSLDRLLDALDRQVPTTLGMEVIVVDDGSSDQTATVVASHPAASYLHQANAGPAAARNRGWQAARAGLVAFTDDDVVPEPTWAAQLVAAFDAAPALDGVGGRVEPLVRGFVQDYCQLEQLATHGVTPSGDLHYLVTANACFRRSVLEALGGFSTRFPRASGEDTDLTLRAMGQGFHLDLIDGAVVRHEHPRSVRRVLRIHHRHGESRRQALAAVDGRAAHPGTPLRPGYWRERYRRYLDATGSRLRAWLYLLLKAAGLAAYGSGMLRARLRHPSPSAAERSR